MRVAVTGCAGLIGFHLSEALLARGDLVVGVDNFSTGRRSNLAELERRRGFSFVEADVCDPATWSTVGEVDAIWQLASPASPSDFATMPGEILRVGSVGTLTSVEHALACGARYLHASTSEVYGEPLVHPQPETYRGNVTTLGPRSCYDESKRFAEAVVSTYARSYGLDGSIARIFNTYGPRMRTDDGRLISTFVVQALRGEPLTVHGDGTQTRSFCHVDDQVRGMLALLDAHEPGPINIGNPDEFTVLEVAKLVIEITGSSSAISYRPLPVDDPSQRRPDISEASSRLGWRPRIDLSSGLPSVVEYYRRRLFPEARPGA